MLSGVIKISIKTSWKRKKDVVKDGAFWKSKGDPLDHHQGNHILEKWELSSAKIWHWARLLRDEWELHHQTAHNLLEAD